MKDKNEIKVLDLEKGDGVALMIDREGTRGFGRINIRFDEIQPVIRLLVAKMKNQEIVEGVLFAESGYGANTKRAFVELSHGISWSIQVSPNEAREYAEQITQAAEAAETDAFIAHFLKDAFRGDDQKVYALINEFREFRNREREKHQEP